MHASGHSPPLTSSNSREGTFYSASIFGYWATIQGSLPTVGGSVQEWLSWRASRPRLEIGARSVKNNEVLVKVEQVSKKYCTSLKRSLRYGVQDIADELKRWRKRKQVALRPDEFWALKDISFELRRGEALGLIGPNGAGKSTLLKLLNGLIKPDAGRITMRGRVGALIELGAGFNPVLTGRENIYINAAVLGQSKKQVDGLIDQIIDFAGIR